MTFTEFPTIELLLRLMDEGKVEESRKLFEKINRRYPQDSEMKRLYDEFESYLMHKKPEKLDNIKKELNMLKIMCKINTMRKLDNIKKEIYSEFK